MQIARLSAACGRWSAALIIWPLVVGLTACETGSPALTANHPLHLEEHLDAARIEGSEVPENPPEAVEWLLEDGPGDWKVAVPPNPVMGPLDIERVEDGVSLVLNETSSRPLPNGRRQYAGGIYVDLPEWTREDWAFVAIRARTADSLQFVEVALNFRDKEDAEGRWSPFRYFSEYVDVIEDGAIHTYIMRADWSWGEWEGPWKQLGIWIGGNSPGRLDLLSVSVIPKAANYADSRAGVATEVRGEAYRRVLYTHAPGRIDFPVRVPDSGRLNVGLGVLRDDIPITFSVGVVDGAEAETVLEKTVTNKEEWDHQSADLSPWAGRSITLTLEAEADEPGTVALWAAPTVSGVRATDKPNVIFYIIDAGGADYMSVYGYNRPTTPNMERLAEEGAVFENAYSNSTWSKTSTPSFATSLQHSVLGGYKTDSDPIPEQAVTMAERLHRAGYQTAVFSSNAYAGTMTSMDRGADALRDAGAEPNSTSTLELHDDFWSWREAFPGEPYFVHFQTTDVHWPWKPAAPFAGSFVDPELRERFYEWERQLAQASGRPRPRWLSHRAYPDSAYEKTGIDRVALYNAGRGLYDETMAHQDYQLGQLVKRLEVTGEWEHTLLIIAADHGNTHGLGVFDSIPQHLPLFSSYSTRIPLIIVWPERIAGGQRFSQPVSMIDMLPTILDLAGLPPAEVAMGQSLAPLLLGQEGWEPRPVVFDEFYVDWDTGELEGTIEVIDGRWGASLSIESKDDDDAADEDGDEDDEERPRLLLFDLWNDPYCLNSLHEERPDLVEKYTKYLEEMWEAHRALAQRFSRTGEVPLTPEQLRTLRSLGYIQ
jgi:arylsulfatase A-like enzyme